MTDNWITQPNATDKCMEEIERNNPSISEGTKKLYNTIIDKLLYEWFKDSIEEKEDCVLCIGNLPAILEKHIELSNFILEHPWTDRDLSDRTLKNYFSVLCSITRGMALDGGDWDKAYKGYSLGLETLKKSINAQEEKQEPSDKDVRLKEIGSINELRKELRRTWRKWGGGNRNSALMYMLGLLHTRYVFRNELCEIIYRTLPRSGIPTDLDPNTNYIFFNTKQYHIVINNNKVRKVANGDECKIISYDREQKEDREILRALNRYKTLCDGTLESGKRLVSNTKGEFYMTNGNYTETIKNIWKHKSDDWGYITSTSIRKLYAIEMRDTFKGKLIAEKEACKNLDHSQAVHNKNYIIYWD